MPCVYVYEHVDAPSQPPECLHSWAVRPDPPRGFSRRHASLDNNMHRPINVSMNETMHRWNNVSVSSAAQTSSANGHRTSTIKQERLANETKTNRTVPTPGLTRLGRTCELSRKRRRNGADIVPYDDVGCALTPSQLLPCTARGHDIRAVHCNVILVRGISRVGRRLHGYIPMTPLISPDGKCI